MLLQTTPLRSSLSGLRFWAHFEALTQGDLPDFSGSTFRGVFGHALKAVSCTMHHRNCGACNLTDSCPYFQIFECESPEHKDRGLQYQPQPYCLHSLPTRPHFEPGQDFNLGFTLIGDSTVPRLPYVLLALQLLEKFPIGKSRMQLRLIGLQDEQNYIPFPSDLPPDFGSLQNQNRIPKSSFLLYLDTPLRIRIQGKDQRHLTQENLRSALKNRYKLLHEFFGQFCPEDLDPLNAFEVEPIESRAVAHTRYSSRQSHKHFLPGILGLFRIHSQSDQVFSILDRLQPFHLGKNTSFGYGQFRIE